MLIGYSISHFFNEYCCHNTVLTNLTQQLTKALHYLKSLASVNKLINTYFQT